MQSKSRSAAASSGDFVIKIIGGAMKGTEIPLKSQTQTIGRSNEADIVFHDNLVSRVHCRLSWEEGKWFLEDLESTNGTWMVGQRVAGKALIPPKTPVRIGNTLFELFNIYSGEDTVSVSLPFLTYSLQPETFIPSSTAEKPAPDAVKAAAEQNKILTSVYKFQNQIASTATPEKLHQKILGAIFNIMTVEKAFLIIYNLEKGIFVPVAGKDKSGPIQNIPESEISKTIVDFVKENRESVLSVDPYAGKQATAVGAPQVKSTMCVPMIVNQQLTGMVYLTMTSATDKYTQDDLRLLTVIGHTAGLALENIRLLEFNLKNERLVATGTTAANLSHHIKNILAGLDGSLNLLQMAIDEKDLALAAESLGILSKNHRRLGNLVLDLLNLTSEQKPNMKMGDLNNVIKDVIELLVPQMSQEGIELKVNPDIKDTPFFAEFDSHGLHRVLLNLICNAEHAINTKKESVDDKSKAGSIYVDAAYDEGKEYIVISVTDDGIGISNEEAQKIFDLFYTSKGSAGTGLGLTVSKRIVEAHGGTISASGEKGKRCTISFTIPISHTESNTATRAVKRIY